MLAMILELEPLLYLDPKVCRIRAFLWVLGHDFAYSRGSVGTDQQTQNTLS